MVRMFFIFYLLLGPILAGAAIMVVLFVPALRANEMDAIIPAASIGMVLGVPLSYWVAKKLMKVPGLLSDKAP